MRLRKLLMIWGSSRDLLPISVALFRDVVSESSVLDATHAQLSSPYTQHSIGQLQLPRNRFLVLVDRSPLFLRLTSLSSSRSSSRKFFTSIRWHVRSFTLTSFLAATLLMSASLSSRSAGVLTPAALIHCFLSSCQSRGSSLDRLVVTLTTSCSKGAVMGLTCFDSCR